MASEDHDFEEINHFSLFGKTYTWETEQKGAVGKFSPKGIEQLLAELPEKVDIFENAYKNAASLSDATRQFVHDLFGSEGLVVLDPDHTDLKRAFSKVIKSDILHNEANALVEKTTGQLEALNYKGPGFFQGNQFLLFGKGAKRKNR